ncbi:CopG family transcriptional regulator [Mycobacterium sp. P7213]|uniref:CopG family transcriptional regulator n=1 Tax=Mycobacterium sp. P7213 TaxID=2478465 RepID=UPI000F63B3FB|nr:CopG family transcriptional regulator [Mycobacterium sp. P7213]
MLNVRTTVVIDSDVAAEIERLRRQGLGISEALNLLARRGIAASASAPGSRYRHRSAPIGLKVDVTNVAQVLDLLDDDR